MSYVICIYFRIGWRKNLQEPQYLMRSTSFVLNFLWPIHWFSQVLVRLFAVSLLVGLAALRTEYFNVLPCLHWMQLARGFSMFFFLPLHQRQGLKSLKRTWFTVRGCIPTVKCFRIISHLLSCCLAETNQVGCTIPDILVNNSVCDCPWTCADEAPQQVSSFVSSGGQVFPVNCDLVIRWWGCFGNAPNTTLENVLQSYCLKLSCFISYDMHYATLNNPLFYESPYKPPSIMGWFSNKVGIACAGWWLFQRPPVPVPAIVLMANVCFPDPGWLHRSVIFHQTYQPRNQVMFASARPRANNSTIITILTSRMNLHPQAGGFPFCPACQVRVSRFWQDILETRTQSHAHTHQWISHSLDSPATFLAITSLPTCSSLYQPAPCQTWKSCWIKCQIECEIECQN